MAAARAVFDTDDFLTAIFSQLPARALTRAACVSSGWRDGEAHSLDLLWRSLLKADWPADHQRWCQGLPPKERYRTFARFLPVGVQRNLPMSFLDGWQCHLAVRYSRSTQLSLHDVPASATHVFLGARAPDGTITLGAVGERDVVLQETIRDYDDDNDFDDAFHIAGPPHLKDHNGCSWYFVRELSIGFSRVPLADLHAGDIRGVAGFDEPADEDADSRLSWHLDGEGLGQGWRLGSAVMEWHAEADGACGACDEHVRLVYHVTLGDVTGLKENVPDVPKAASQPKLAPTLEDFFSDDD